MDQNNPEHGEHTHNTKENEKMSKNDTTRMMREVVERAGGRISRHDYIVALCDEQVKNGYDLNEIYPDLTPSEREAKHYASVKSNGFNTGRMVKAGVAKVITGATDKNGSEDWEVWTIEAVEALKAGQMPSTDAPRQQIVKQAPKPKTEAVDGQVWFGIPRRSKDQYPEFLHPRIPDAPTAFVESDQGELRLIAMNWRKGKHTISAGPTGCGKTMAIFEACYQIGQPLLHFNCKDGMTWDDLLGQMTYDGEKTVFLDGLLTQAVRYGTALYIDEISFGNPAVLGGLNDVLTTGVLVIPMTGEVIKAHPDFRAFASHNPGYEGTRRLNDATRRRFSMGITFQYLPPHLEAKVLVDQSGINLPSVADDLVAWANKIREMKKENDGIDTDIGTASLVDCFELLDELSLTEAMRYTVIDLFGDEDEREQAHLTARAIISDYKA